MRAITCKYCKNQFHIDKDKKEIWKEKKFICPFCNISYCILPPTERDLQILQESFLINRDEKILNKMYYILINYSKSLYLKNFYKVMIHPEELPYYIQNSVSILLEYYYKNSEYKIKTSFGGMLIRTLRQALFSKKEHFSEYSLDYKFEDDNFVEIKDTKNYFEIIEKEHDISILRDQLYDIILKMEKYSLNPYENYMRELGLLLHLEKGERYADKFFKMFDKKGKFLYMYTLEIIKKKLKSIPE